MKNHGLLPLIFLIALAIGPGIDSHGQQKVQFTQYMFNGLVINPAYAGADEALSLTFIQRSQWAGVENAPETQTFSGHTLFGKRHIGVGLTLINDKIGVHKSLNALTTYAYHLQVAERAYLSMGLQVGINRRESNYGSLIGGATYDPRLNDVAIAKTFMDFGMGFYFRSPKLDAGFSVPELVPGRLEVNDTVTIQLSKSPYFLFTKYRIKASDFVDVEPSIFVKYQSGIPLSYDLNANMIYRKVLTLGLSYRKAESVDFLFKAQITRQLQIGYAYDHPIGHISMLSNGSHELMAQYVFRFVEKDITSPRR
ncbi:MAG TPA: type IX secretion system membrane protein PorP/SprF [Chryseosolibacter sp.]